MTRSKLLTAALIFWGIALFVAMVVYGQDRWAEYDLVEPCEEGEERPDVDGCNTCTCVGGSSWHCTLMFCKPGEVEVPLVEPGALLRVEPEARWSKGRKATAACLALDVATTAYALSQIDGAYEKNPLAVPGAAVAVWVVLSDRQAKGMKPKHWRIGWGARCTAAAWNLRLIYKYGR